MEDIKDIKDMKDIEDPKDDFEFFYHNILKWLILISVILLTITSIVSLFKNIVILDWIDFIVSVITLTSVIIKYFILNFNY